MAGDCAPGSRAGANDPARQVRPAGEPDPATDDIFTSAGPGPPAISCLPRGWKLVALPVTRGWVQVLLRDVRSDLTRPGIQGFTPSGPGPRRFPMRPAVRPHFKDLAPALALAMAAVACTGTVGSGPSSGSPGPSASGSAGTTGSGSAGNSGSGTAGSGMVTGTAGSGVVTGTGGDGALATCPTTTITPTPLRRLTKFEYANAAKFLLNVTPTAANDL